MTKILFRCDGGALPEIGMGHVIRCLLIADTLRNNQTDISFAMKEYKEGIAKVKEKGYKVFGITVTEDENEATLKIIERISPDIAILDKLNNDLLLLKTIKTLGVVVITLDDQGKADAYSDIRINAIIAAAEQNAPNLYQGPDYVVLPLYEKKLRATTRKQVQKIFLSFGGYDHLNLTQKTLQALESLDAHIGLDAVIGAAYLYKDKLHKFLTHYARPCNVFFNPRDFNALLDQADIAIISGRLTLYQALSRGIPSIVISQYDHQLKTATIFEKQNAVISLGKGPTVKENEIYDAVTQLLQDYNLQEDLRSNGSQSVDGKGLERVAQLIDVVKEREWDTDFFGFKIARLHPKCLTKDIMRYAFRKCNEENIECLYYLCNYNDSKSILLAKKYLFDQVDTRVKSHRSLLDYRQIKNEDTIYIRNHKADDITHLKQIAKNVYTLSRFYVDKHFPRELCDHFYATWIENSCKGYADKVFVAETKGKIAGFITCDLNERMKNGRIGLVGVASFAQGKKVGVALVVHALNWFSKKKVLNVEVMTQERNIAAQKLYWKCGFKILKKEIWFHKWFT